MSTWGADGGGSLVVLDSSVVVGAVVGVVVGVVVSVVVVATVVLAVEGAGVVVSVLSPLVPQAPTRRTMAMTKLPRID
jgi:hypothetical protein